MPPTSNANSDRATSETLDGYVVDLACVRKYPRTELTDRARQHTTRCALMGHCVESGYALIGDDNGVVPLDAAATPFVVTALQRTERERGVRLRAHRAMHEKEMVTTSVEEASAAQDGGPV